MDTIAKNTVEVVAVGNGLGIELSSEVLKTLGAESGDRLVLQPTETGVALALHPLAKELRLMEQIMKRRDQLLRKLAE